MSAIFKIDFLICLTNALSGTKITLCRYDIQYGCHCGQLENCVRVCMCLFIWAGIACQNYLKCVDYKVILLVQIYLNVDVLHLIWPSS